MSAAFAAGSPCFARHNENMLGRWREWDSARARNGESGIVEKLLKDGATYVTPPPTRKKR